MLGRAPDLVAAGHDQVERPRRGQRCAVVGGRGIGPDIQETLPETGELRLLALVAEVLVDERRHRQIDHLQVGLELGGRGGQAQAATVFDVRRPVVDEAGVVALLRHPAAQGIGLQRGTVVVAEMESENADFHFFNIFWVGVAGRDRVAGLVASSRLTLR